MAESSFEERARAIGQNRLAAEAAEALARIERDSDLAAFSRQLAEVFRDNANYLERTNRERADG